MKPLLLLLSLLLNGLYKTLSLIIPKSFLDRIIILHICHIYGKYGINVPHFIGMTNAPSVSTSACSGTTQTQTTGNGNITNTGGENATVRGFCYLQGTSGDPTTANSVVSQSGSFGTGTFSLNITGLSLGTSYRVRAYATNSAGTGYGTTVDVTTSSAVAPTVTTQAVSNISYTTATGNGNVTSDGGATITERGVCWNTTGTPTTSNSKATSAGTTGAFTASMTGLQSGTTYYVRAYAINAQGTSYGSEVSFTTLNYSPTVALNSPNDTATISDTTPDLTFTGTDSESDDIEYQVQVNTSSAFGSVDSYSETNQDTTFTYGNTSSSASMFGQTFTGNGDTLATVTVYIAKRSGVTGNAYAKIYAHTGTFGSNGTPTGSVLATSDAFDVSALTTSLSLAEFTFSGAEQIALNNETKYVVIIDCENLSNALSIDVGIDSTSPSHSGNFVDDDAGFWNSYSAYDMPFYINNSNVLLNKVSETDTGFSGSPDNTHPFTSGQQVTYTVQAGDALPAGTYYWRVRGIDPSGSNTYGAWSTEQSFTITGGATTNSKANSAKSNIEVTTSQANSAKSSIVTTNTKNNSAKSNVVVTNTKNTSVKQNIRATTSKNTYSIGNISTTGQQPNYAKANIAAATTGKNNTAKGSIVTTNTQHNQTKSSIVVTEIRGNNTKSSIVRTETQNNSTKGSIVTTNSNDQSAKANIVNTSPTVVLNSPSDTESITDTTPDLLFTGTDIQGEDIRYNVQVDTVNTFDSQGTGYFTDFSDYTTNAQPSDWTQYWYTTGITHTVKEDAGYTGGKYLEIEEAGAFSRTALAWENTNFPSTADVEMYFKMDITTMGIPFPALRASGSLETARTGYVFLFRNDTDTIDIRRAVSGSETSLGTQAFTFSDNTIYHFRVRVITTDASTVTVYARVWADGNSEPETWTLTVTDTNAARITSAGRVQLGTTGNTAAFGKVDVVGVAFGGDTAPTSSSGGGALIDATSGTDPGFTGSPDNTDPYTSGQQVTYTVQAGDALSPATYYWRARGIDPTGSNAYGEWSSTQSFTVVASQLYAQSAKANISATITHGNFAKASIVTTNSNGNNSKGNIKATIASDNFAKASVVVTNSYGNSAKSSIVETRNYDSQIKSNIRATQTKGNSAKASIQIQSEKPHYAKANILRIGETKNNHTKASIVITNLFNNQSKASIVATNSNGNSTKANIVVTEQDANNGKANIRATQTQSNNAKGSIASISAKNNSTRANIYHVACVLDQEQLEDNTNVTFGNTSTYSIAQSFQPSITGKICNIRIKLGNSYLATDNVTLKIYTGATQPTTLIDTATTLISGSDMPWEAGLFFVDFVFDNGTTLTADTQYWFVLERTGAYDNDSPYYSRYKWDGSVDPYARGKLMYLHPTNGWLAFGDYADLYFRLYIKEDKNNYTKGSIVATNSAANQSKGNILTTNTDNQYGKGSIVQTIANSGSVKTNIRASQQKHHHVKASIVKEGSYSHYVKANILDTYTKESNSKGSVVTTNAMDSSIKSNIIAITSSNNNAIANIAPGYNAVSLNGTSQWGLVPNYDLMEVGGTGTIEGWVYLTDGSRDTYGVSHSLITPGSNWAAYIAEDGTSRGINFARRYSTTNADGYTTTAHLTANTWVHTALVFVNGEVSKVYVNGTEITYDLQQTPVGTLTSTDGMQFAIGRFEGTTSNRWNGRIACSRLWSVARTQEEINTNKGYYLDPQNENGLVLNLNFTEGEGSSVANNVSGGENMALVDSPSWAAGPTITYKEYGTRAISSARANIIRSQVENNSAKASIVATNSNSQNTKGNVVVTINNNNNSAKGSIVTTNTNDNSGKTNIKSTYTKNNVVTASISTTGQQTQYAKANILRVGETKDNHATSSVVVTETRDSSVKTSIVVTNTYGNQSKGSIVTTNTNDNDVKNSIVTTNSNGNSTKAQIVVTHTNNVYVKQNIKSVQTKGNSAKGAIQIGSQYPLYAKGNIEATETQNVSTKGNILVTGYMQGNNVVGNIGPRELDWSRRYEANETPNNADPAWDGSPTATLSIVDGILHVESEIGEGAYFTQPITTFAGANYALETRGKLTTGSAYADGDYNQGISIYLDNTGADLIIYTDAILIASGANESSPYYMDTTDTYHVYRLVINNGIAYAFVDGVLQATLNTVPFLGSETIDFYPTGTSVATVTDWDYVYYYASIYPYSRHNQVTSSIVATNSVNNQVKSNFVATDTKNNNTKASIVTTNTSDNQSKTSIVYSNILDILVKSNIRATQTKTNNVKASIVNGNNAPQYTKGNIKKTQTQNNTTTACILQTETNRQYSKGSIVTTNSYGQSVKAYIGSNTYTYDHSVKAYIYIRATYDVSTKGNIKTTIFNGFVPVNFGYVTVGSLQVGISANNLVGTGFTAPQSGTLSTASVYSRAVASFGRVIRAVIIDAETGIIIENGISESTAVISTTKSQWYYMQFRRAPQVTAGRVYIIGLIGNATMQLNYDNETIYNVYDSTNSFSSPTDPTDNPPRISFASKYSAFASYSTGQFVTANVSGTRAQLSHTKASIVRTATHDVSVKQNIGARVDNNVKASIRVVIIYQGKPYKTRTGPIYVPKTTGYNPIKNIMTEKSSPFTKKRNPYVPK